MIIKNKKDCEEFIAGDGTRLRELFNPIKDSRFDLRYSLAHFIVQIKETTFLHSLKNSEVYYIIKGRGLMTVGQNKKEVTNGDYVYIPAGEAQQIQNIGDEDIEALCIVDPAWKSEDETILN